jgi:hypothetical protein
VKGSYPNLASLKLFNLLEVIDMSIRDTLQNWVQYFTEGFARIFGPSQDEYPEVGVQPFESDTYVESDEKK